MQQPCPPDLSYFYPRPPRGGRRGHDRQEQAADGISIHALREEGDCGMPYGTQPETISIHALREEGDSSTRESEPKKPNFYPRPPRGGRPLSVR